MKNEIKILKPKAITLLTTFKCTAACRNCCFQCSPKCEKKMTAAEMKHYIDTCLIVYPEIKTVVFTGGECTLLGQDLIKTIKYAKINGLSTRIVTNGWWAKDYMAAQNKINMLQQAGLDEINFSTGDDHQQWIPFTYVRNAAVAAFRQGMYCAINVETKDDSKFNIDKIIEKDHILSEHSTNNIYERRKIYIEKGIWAQFDGSNEKITYKAYESNFKFKRCKNLFSIIPINPYGEVLACCGITSESNLYMRLGNINHENIKTVYERAFCDVLKLWLFTEGPEKIAKFLLSHEDENDTQINVQHTCLLCRKISCSKKYIDILIKYRKEYMTNLILKYNLLTFKEK